MSGGASGSGTGHSASGTGHSASGTGHTGSATGLWGGRFAGAQDPRFLAFQESLSLDSRLWREDLEGSRAWARALVHAEVLGADEGETLVRALDTLEAELAAEPGRLARSGAEDIHSHVEARLGELVGPLAKKLHTGRSRNDQVATDLKLYLRRAAQELAGRVRALQGELVALAERSAALALPGYTHQQRAQPITAGHHALAYVEMLERDRGRIQDALVRMDTCPLGSGALAGTAFPVDRAALAAALGFAGGPTRNSLDAVGDRDHLVELCSACALILVHLSRLAEDWIFFCTTEAGFLELDDAVCTGSSLMPQKKNPDSLELVRGRAGHVVGALQALLFTLKALPLAYDRDLQEDKRSVFAALDQTVACLEVTALVVQGARYRPERCRAAAASGYLNATDLADLLVHAGVPFRTAHERAGQAVRRALELGVELEHLPAEDRARLVPELQVDLTAALSVEAVLDRRAVFGGTAPARVREAAAAWRQRLGAAT
jgi:argininosuccinate lyase